jgi:glycosyltransferase involved in cell wall biosynthesis
MDQTMYQPSEGIKFTYIIAYRHSLDRYLNLKRVLDWVNGFSGSEVIVVEQDTHSKISHLNLPCRVIFTKSDIPFNKSNAFNVGVKASRANIVVFGDSDLIMKPDEFIDALNDVQNYEMVNPYHSVIDLTAQESMQDLSNMVRIDRPGRGETDIQKVPLCGGICIFRKDAILKIGAWCEDFIGWGGEDDFQSVKVKNFLSWVERPNRCYHLFHERTAPDMKWYQRNLQLLQKLGSLSKEDLQRHIMTSAPKIGLKNKYDNF